MTNLVNPRKAIIGFSEVKYIMIDKSRWDCWIEIADKEGKIFKYFLSADSFYDSNDGLFLSDEKGREEWHKENE